MQKDGTSVTKEKIVCSTIDRCGMSISLLQNENYKKVKLVERPFKDFTCGRGT